MFHRVFARRQRTNEARPARSVLRSASPTRQAVLASAWVCVFAVGCAEIADDARSSEVQLRILEDNRALLEREPHLTALKFQKMARSPYAFLRGTPALFLDDLTRPGAWPTQCGSNSSAVVASIGDAHPENIGTYRREDGTFFLDFNDFDGVMWGPYHFEVRRLALSFALLAQEVYGPEHPELVTLRRELAEAVSSGYAEEIFAEQRGEAPLAVRLNQPPNAVSADLFQRAKEDGDRRDELTDYTELVDGKRRLRTGVLRLPEDAVYERELWLVSDDVRAMIEHLLAQWPASTTFSGADALADYTLVDVRRRIGAGVGSYPILRFYALLQGPSGLPDDVLLLDIKESRDAAVFPAVVRYPARVFTYNSERSVTMQRDFQEFPDADPILGFAHIGALSFRIQDTSKHQKGFDVPRVRSNLRSGEWKWGQLVKFAELSGGLLARGHAKALTAHGVRGLTPIANALEACGDAFVTETIEFSEAYSELILADYQRFIQLLDEHGDLLGYR